MRVQVASSDEPASADASPSLVRTLTTHFMAPLIVLGVLLLVGLLWQGLSSTRAAAQQDISQILDRSAERLHILLRAAELTAESAQRAARTPPVSGATLRPMLESLLAAFEQRPELSYIGVALASTGEYGTLERTDDGRTLLWLFPGARATDAFTRNFVLTEHGFVPNEATPTDGYDPRQRPFYIVGANSPPTGTWLPAYQWIVHADKSAKLWGITFVQPLRDAGGQLVGVLDTDLDLLALNRFLREIGREHDTTLQIVEMGETPRLIGDLGIQREPLPLPDYLQPFVEFSGESFLSRIEMHGERRWAAARRLQHNGASWMLVASRNQPLIATPLRNQLYQLLAAGIAIALIIALVSWRMARRLGRPLTHLEQMVSSLQRGDPVPHDAGCKEFRETRVVGEAFQRMAVAVRQRETELHDRNERLRSHLENTPLAVIEWDGSGHITSLNASTLTLFGHRTPATLLGQPLMSLFAPADQARVQEALDPQRSRTRQKQLVARIASSDGLTPECEWYITQLDPDADGETRTSALVLDISALRQSLARFNAAARATGDVIWDWDLTTNRIWWNENFQALTGFPAAELEPSIESWTRRIHPEDHDRVVAHIRAAIEGNEETWSDEYRLRRRDGGYASVYDRGFVLRDANGRGVRMVGAIMQITAILRRAGSRTG